MERLAFGAFVREKGAMSERDGKSARVVVCSGAEHMFRQEELQILRDARRAIARSHALLDKPVFRPPSRGELIITAKPAGQNASPSSGRESG
jgi:hypothetical protein